MLWLFLSLVAALSQATNDTLAKKYFGNMSAYEMGMIRLLYGLPYLIAGFFIVPHPSLDKTFWICLSLGLPLELTALLCYMEAIKVSPLSLTIPFLAFTPAFIILTGWIILGEKLSVLGIAGIAMIVGGSYLLNLSSAQRQWLAPFRAIFMERGSRLMLLVALIYSVTSTLGKLAIQHSSPQFFGITYFMLFAFLVMLLFPFVPGRVLSNPLKRILPAVLAGIVLAVMIFSHTLAISLIEAAYMISVKRTSILFGVIFGAVVFKEERFRERLSGACTMMAGVVIIGIFG